MRQLHQEMGGWQGVTKQLAHLIIIIHHQNPDALALGLSAEPFVDGLLMKAPLPSNLRTGQLTARCEAVNRDRGHIQIGCQLSDGQDIRYRFHLFSSFSPVTRAASTTKLPLE